MKIVHVVTFISKDGAFGGPVAVALGQLEELARQGHDVELLAGWDGQAEVAASGVKVTLFKTRRLSKSGFSGLWAPGLARAARARAISGCRVHIHLARDLVTLPAALAVATVVRPVLQTHGMVMPDARSVLKLIDRCLTTFIFRRARCVLALTEKEASGIRKIGGTGVTVETIANGVRVPALSPVGRRGNEVVFLARLHPRKRVMAFAEMSRILIARGIRAKFVVIGPDEGDLGRLRSFIKTNNLDQHMCYEGVLQTGASVPRLAEAGVYVLPSTGEVFPMTVLEALAAGTPVVTTISSGIAPHLSRLGAAEIVEESPDALADAVQRILLNQSLRASLISNGYRGLATTFSIEAVSSRLSVLYSTDE